MPCFDCGEAMTPTLLVCLPCADKRQTRDRALWFTILLRDTGMTPNEKHDKGDKGEKPAKVKARTTWED